MQDSYNLYCDESCHLEHDNSRYMALGGIRCLKSERRKIVNDIRDLKERHGLSRLAEIKWSSVSDSKVDFYIQLVKYFFEIEEMNFRAVIVDKSQISLDENQRFIDFYYKMYFYVLSGLIKPNSKNSIYLDKVDSKSIFRVRKLHEILCNSNYDFKTENINRVQNISSYESEILQLTDLFIGAITYENRGLTTSSAKLKVIEMIMNLSGYDLKRSTLHGEEKFNIFKIKLQDRNNG